MIYLFSNKSSLAVACLLTISSVYGQSFRPGVVFLKNGETLQGAIEYHESNYERCTIKQVSGEVVYYQPKDVLAFEVDGHRIEPHLINDENRFIEVLLKSKVSLLYDGSSFYAVQGGKTYKLVYEKRDEVVGGTRRQVINRRYLGIFNMFFPTCAPLLKEAEKMVFSRKSLIDIMKKFAMCSNSEFTIYGNSEKSIEIDPVVQIAFSNTYYHFDTPESVNSHLQKNLKDKSFAFSIGADITQPQFSEKISIRLESWYNSNSYNRTAPSESITYDTRELSFKWNELGTVLGVKYGTLKKNTPYVIVHWNSCFVLNSALTQVYRNISTGDTEESRPFEFKKVYFGAGTSVGYTFEVGAKTKLFSECRYVYGYGALKEAPLVTSSNHSLKFSVGFIF